MVTVSALIFVIGIFGALTGALLGNLALFAFWLALAFFGLGVIVGRATARSEYHA